MVYLDPPTVLLTPGPAAGVTGEALVLTCAASGTARVLSREEVKKMNPLMIIENI